MNVALIHDPEKVGLLRARGKRAAAGRNSICMPHDLFSLRADSSSGPMFSGAFYDVILH